MVSNIAHVIIAFSVITGALANADQGTTVQALTDLRQNILGPQLKGVSEQTMAVGEDCRIVVSNAGDAAPKQKDAFLIMLESPEFREEFIFSNIGQSMIFRQPSQVGDGEMVMIDYKIRGLSARGEQVYFSFQLIRTDTRIYLAKVVLIPLSPTGATQTYRCTDGI